MKVIAMYLPQFHEVEENNRWWGEGFTEWTAVKKARPLFDNHKQPNTPLNENYYNLLDKQTMQWQVNLMKKYGVDGMCFYHYYFKDGKKILEKPAENLLAWKNIDMPFCFSWANESWIRSWSNVNDGNPWMYDEKDAQKVKESNGVLLEQKYGEKEDWEKHFYYLLPFFKDDRYIKIENRPVFLIYKPDIIPCLKEMINYWNQLCEKEGMGYIYLLGENTNRLNSNYISGVVYHEPQNTLNRFFEGKFDNSYGLQKVLDYDDVWN